MSKSHQVSEGCNFAEAIVPFCYYSGGVGKCAQAKQSIWTQGQWPIKSDEFLLYMFTNAESNAELDVLEVQPLGIEHIQ